MIWQRDRRNDADNHLDQWIREALDAELMRMDADFNFEAGLADVYARAGLARPRVTESPSREACTVPKLGAGSVTRFFSA